MSITIITALIPAKVRGDTKDHYWLADRPDIHATAATNGLNKLCRKLVAMGFAGSAEVRGTDGKLRFTVPSIEKLAVKDLREHSAKGLYEQSYRPFPSTNQNGGNPGLWRPSALTEPARPS